MAACTWSTTAWRSATAPGFDFRENLSKFFEKALNTNCHVPNTLDHEKQCITGKWIHVYSINWENSEVRQGGARFRGRGARTARALGERFQDTRTEEDEDVVCSHVRCPFPGLAFLLSVAGWLSFSCPAHRRMVAHTMTCVQPSTSTFPAYPPLPPSRTPGPLAEVLDADIRRCRRGKSYISSGRWEGT
jgi:hypothetical protein